MSRNADRFLRQREETNSKVKGDYIIWPDGCSERITDPGYWVAREEIQHRLKGEHAVYDGWGGKFWVRD
jgi:hypothetical protein